MRKGLAPEVSGKIRPFGGFLELLAAIAILAGKGRGQGRGACCRDNARARCRAGRIGFFVRVRLFDRPFHDLQKQNSCGAHDAALNRSARRAHSPEKLAALKASAFFPALINCLEVFSCSIAAHCRQAIITRRSPAESIMACYPAL